MAYVSSTPALAAALRRVVAGMQARQFTDRAAITGHRHGADGSDVRADERGVARGIERCDGGGDEIAAVASAFNASAPRSQPSARSSWSTLSERWNRKSLHPIH